MTRSPNPPAPTPVPASATRRRVVFVDVARACAVLFMIQGHALNVLMAREYHAGLAYDGWLFLRGLTSCTFLLLSGFAFTVASSHYWDAHRRPSWRMAKRLGRFAFFVGLGYALRFPVTRLEHFQFVGDAVWRTFFTVDVLQCIGVTLIGLELLILLARTRARFASVSALLAVAVVVLTPAAWRTDWTGVAPLWLAAYFSPATGSIFPLLPWTAYIFAGAALGHVFLTAWSDAPAAFARRLLLPAGLALLAGGVGLGLLPVSPLGPTDFWHTSPALFFVKLGCVCLALAGLSELTRGMTHLPRAVAALAHESLFIYFIHVLVLYGSCWNTGLYQWVGAVFTPLQTAGFILALWITLGAVAWGWTWTKRRHRRAALLVRGGVLAWVIYSLW